MEQHKIVRTVSEAEELILQKRKEIEELERAKVDLMATPEAKELANALHDLLCSGTGSENHTDGCGWFYENSTTYPGGTWNGYEHKRYLRKAKQLLERGFDADVTQGVLQALKEIGRY